MFPEDEKDNEKDSACQMYDIFKAYDFQSSKTGKNLTWRRFLMRRDFVSFTFVQRKIFKIKNLAKATIITNQALYLG